MRQARSEATRQKIINAAVDLFGEVGYADTGLGGIIERAELTKGALYYHFDSKESLAAAIIEEGGAVVLSAFQTAGRSPAPALECLIHGVFAAAELIIANRVARTAVQLSRTLGEFSEVAARTYGQWLAEMTTQARSAHAEGDLVETLDPDAAAESILAGVLGIELISTVMTGDEDLLQRLTRSWNIMLPAIAAEASLTYFRQFLARESLRRVEPTLSV